MVVLACVMCATPVFAKKMYLVRKIQFESPYSFWTYEFTYKQKMGLLDKFVMSDSPDYYSTYTYNRNGVLKEIGGYGESGLEAKFAFKFGKNGKLASVDVKSMYGKEVSYSSLYKYAWGTNKCKVTATDVSPTTYKFDAKGRVVQETISATDGTIKYKFTYDNKGFINSRKIQVNLDGQKSSYETLYENVYKTNPDRLSKVYYIDEEGFNKISYFYKGYEVPDRFVSKVEAQQDYLTHQAVDGDTCLFMYPVM